MAKNIRIGIGGWTFAPWRGVFYPKGLAHARELGFASRALSSIEINGTFYSTFKPDSWAKWRDETPDDFVFAVKASRYCTNRRVLADAGGPIERFLNQGLTRLGPKLGPINWQFMATKKFDPADFEAFLKLLPGEHSGLALRHAVEVRHPSFEDKRFYALARRYRVAIVYAPGGDFPEIDEATADFKYVRVLSSRTNLKSGLTKGELVELSGKLRDFAKRRDVFAYVISGAKVRNPAAAQALMTMTSQGAGKHIRRG